LAILQFAYFYETANFFWVLKGFTFLFGLIFQGHYHCLPLCLQLNTWFKSPSAGGDGGTAIDFEIIKALNEIESVEKKWKII